MGIGNSTARYIEASGVSFEVDIPDACASIDTRSRGYGGKGREGKGGGRGGRISLSRASLGDARHEIFKIQMATRIRSRALRLIRNFLNSNAFKLAPPLPPSPLPFPTITRIFFLSSRITLCCTFFFFFLLFYRSMVTRILQAVN